jgi:thymidylate synthase (FAD)
LVNHLDAINVKLVGAPSIDELKQIVGVFMKNTWNDRLFYGPWDDAEMYKTIRELFAGQILPTGMETINLVFTIEGMDMIDTTHLIRHRMFSFSAQTQADRDMRHDRVMVSPQIASSSEFLGRYEAIVSAAYQLYVDMIDSGEVDTLEARTVMPAAVEKFYICRGTIKDVIAYVNLRIDEQIQPWSDVIIAMKLWLEVVKLYPFLKKFVDFRSQDKFYIEQCKEGKTNIFPPNQKNDIFEWSESQFYHNRHRDEYIGGSKYLEHRNEFLIQIEAI